MNKSCATCSQSSVCPDSLEIGICASYTPIESDKKQKIYYVKIFLVGGNDQIFRGVTKIKFIDLNSASLLRLTTINGRVITYNLEHVVTVVTEEEE